MLRIIVIDISMPLGSEVYDEVIIPVGEATEFCRRYIDMTRFRIITV